MVSARARFVSDELRSLADPAAAVGMAAYMKTDMPFYGVKKPQRDLVLREMTRRFPMAGRDDYVAGVLELWSMPHREEKYLAIALARSDDRFVDLDSVALYRRLIIEGAWWDFVDDVAVHLVGGVHRADRDRMTPILDAWVDDPVMWLRRTAIIAQLGHGADTDADRLFDYCLRRAAEKEFFIRKAIGWALRQYARTDPGAVRAFVLSHRQAWSALTFREATKHLDVVAGADGAS